MEALVSLVCLALLGAAVAVIIIAVGTLGIKSQLNDMMSMFKARLLPGLENLEKIQHQLEYLLRNQQWRPTAPGPEAAAESPAAQTAEPSAPAESAPAFETPAGTAFPTGYPEPPATETAPPPTPVESAPAGLYQAPSSWNITRSPAPTDIYFQPPTPQPETPPRLEEEREEKAAGETLEAPDMSEIMAALEEAGAGPERAAAPEVAEGPEAPADADLSSAEEPETVTEGLAAESLSAAEEPEAATEGLAAEDLPAAGESPAPPAPPQPPLQPSALTQALDAALMDFLPKIKSFWRQSLDFLMKEGHIWVLTGVLVLLLGISFFVRYSIAMGWFSPPLRLASSALLGMVIFSLGFRLRESRRAYGLLLQSCGLGIMYLTTVGAVRLYGLLGSLPALGVLSLLVALTAALALWQNTQLLAHVSLAAAFLAPILVSQNSGNYVGLFSYYCVINAGILTMSFFRPWRWLYLTGFALTFGIFSFWAATSYQREFFSRTMPFLLAFYAFYTLMSLKVGRQRQDGEGRGGRRFLSTDRSLSVLTPLVFLVLAAYIAWNEPYVLAGCAFGLGLIHILLARLTLKDFGRSGAFLFLSQGMIYANLALPLTFLSFKPELFRPGWMLGLVWALEGAFIYRAGAAEGRAPGRLFGTLLLLLSAALGLHSLLEISRPLALMSPTFLLILLVAAGFLLAAEGAAVHRDRLAPFERKWAEAFTLIALLWLFSMTLVEVYGAAGPVGPRVNVIWLLIAFCLEAGLLNLAAHLRRFWEICGSGARRALRCS